MADVTLRRRTGLAKQFFKEASECRYVDSNSFEKLVRRTRGNEKRQFFVKPDVIEACMEHCPCGDWQTILALTRFGGLRCPSELVALRWTDVDLPGGKFTVTASKTEHHATGGVRFIEVSQGAWDHHAKLQKSFTTNGLAVDQPIAALIADLQQRKLLDETLIVWGGEFGRTPASSWRGGDGRDVTARLDSKRILRLNV